MQEMNMSERIKICSTMPSGRHSTFTVPRYMAPCIIRAILKETYDMIDLILQDNNIAILPFKQQTDICSNVLYGQILPNKSDVKLIF